MNESNLPVDPKTGKARPPMQQPGYYPGYRTLGQQDFWDAATRRVVLDRVNNIPPIRFFNEQEAATLEAVCNCAIPQDDRDEAFRIPIMPQIDKRLHEDSGDGYRFEKMPEDRDAYKWGIQAINEMSQKMHGVPFVGLDRPSQEQLLKSLHQGKPAVDNPIWHKMPVHRFWMLVLTDCIQNYYAHPWAWDEIGYGGPAYPRAYMRLEHGEPEYWEVREKRYEWEAPSNSISGEFSSIAGESEHRGGPSQGGTH